MRICCTSIDKEYQYKYWVLQTYSDGINDDITNADISLKNLIINFDGAIPSKEGLIIYRDNNNFFKYNYIEKNNITTGDINNFEIYFYNNKLYFKFIVSETLFFTLDIDAFDTTVKDNNNNYAVTTYIVYNSSPSTSTQEYTDTKDFGLYYLGPTDLEHTWTYSKITDFQKFQKLTNKTNIINVFFKENYSVINVNSKFSYYEIPIKSNLMFEALNLRSIGAVSIDKLFSNEKNTITIDTFVNNLITNIDDYNNIQSIGGEINKGYFDQLFFYNLYYEYSISEKVAIKELYDYIKSFEDTPRNENLYRDFFNLYTFFNNENDKFDSSPYSNDQYRFLKITVKEFQNENLNSNIYKSISILDEKNNLLESLYRFSYTIDKKISQIHDLTFICTRDSDVYRMIRDISKSTVNCFTNIHKSNTQQVYDYYYFATLLNYKNTNIFFKIKFTNLTNSTDELKKYLVNENPKRTIDQIINLKASLITDITDNGTKNNLVSFSLKNDTNQLISSDGTALNNENFLINGTGVLNIDKSKYFFKKENKSLSFKEAFNNYLKFDTTGSNDNFKFIFGIDKSLGEIDTDNTIISFNFNVYQFGFEYEKDKEESYRRYADKVCFIDYETVTSKDENRIKYELSFKLTALLTDNSKINFYSIKKNSSITEENATFIPFQKVTKFYSNNSNNKKTINIDYNDYTASKIELTNGFIETYISSAIENNDLNTINVFPKKWFGENNQNDKSTLEAGSTIKIDIDNNSTIDVDINNTYTVYEVFVSDKNKLVEITPNEYTLNYYAFNKDANNISIKEFVNFPNKDVTNELSNWFLKSENISIDDTTTSIENGNLIYRNPNIFNESDLKRFEIKVDNESPAYAYNIDIIKFFTEKDNDELKASDAYNKDWTNFKSLNENGYIINPDDEFEHKIFVGLTPNLIKKKIPLFVQSVYNKTWYLRDKDANGINNDIEISVYPNENYRIFPKYSEDTEKVEKLFIEHYYDHTNDIKTQKEIENFKIDGIDLTEFLFRESYSNKADKVFFTTKYDQDNLNLYFDTTKEINKTNLNNNEEVSSKCVIVARKDKTFTLTTNGGWIPYPNSLVQKRDNPDFIISNKVVLNKDNSYNDDYLIENQLSQIDHRENGSLEIKANRLQLQDKKGSLESKRELGISYDITYTVPVGTPISNNYYSDEDDIFVQHVNKIDLKNNRINYYDDQNTLKVNLNSYIVNLPQNFDKTAYEWASYVIDNPLQESTDKWEYDQNFRIIDDNIHLTATYTPINYEIYLSYLDMKNKSNTISEALGTELRLFNFEDTLDIDKRDNNPANLPATITGDKNITTNFNYKGYKLSDGWYILPEKTKINSLDNDEFLENTIGPKSVLCYCEPQLYNIYIFDSLKTEVYNDVEYYRVSNYIENIPYNSYVDIGSAINTNGDTSKKYKYTTQISFDKSTDVVNNLDKEKIFFKKDELGAVTMSSIHYDSSSKNVFNPCGNFNSNDTIKDTVPNIFFVNEYEENQVQVQVQYFDANNQIRFYSIIRDADTVQDIYNLFTYETGTNYYHNNNLQFFNETAIFKYYTLAYENNGKYITLLDDTSISSFDPNFSNTNFFESIGDNTGRYYLKIDKSNILRFYDFINAHSNVIVTPKWESYEYDVAFDIGSGTNEVVTLNSNQLYSFKDSIYKDNQIIINFIKDNTTINNDLYRYYCGWADSNGTLMFTKNQENVKNLVSINRESVFDKDNPKKVADTLLLKAYFTKRMTNKNGVKFKKDDRFYCEDVKLMIKCIDDKGFWDIDKDFGNN